MSNRAFSEDKKFYFEDEEGIYYIDDYLDNFEDEDTYNGEEEAESQEEEIRYYQDKYAS